MGNRSPGKIKREGREAFEDGLLSEDCPYKDNWNFENWMEGWTQGEKEYEAEQKEKDADENLHREIMCEVDSVSDLVKLLIDRGILT